MTSDVSHLLGPDVPQSKTVVKIGNQDVVLDTDRLRFDETTINVFMDNLAVWYDYFSQRCAEAEILYDKAYSKAFEEAKDEGATEKLAEAKAKQEAAGHKLKWLQLKAHLRAWDRAHDNAQSRGHMIRKEMDKLNTEIMFKNRHLEEQVDEIVRKKGNTSD